MRDPHAKQMKMLVLLGFLATVPASAVLGTAPDQRRGEQQRVYEARREGRLMSLREIEARVVPTMRGAQYIGSDLDQGSDIYTLKFLRDGTVIWVEVDGRTGQILGRTGR